MGFELSENTNTAAVQTLESLVNSGRLSHAVVIEGGNAAQRTALAGEIAAALVCTSQGKRPCGVCIHCVKARAHIHPDIAVFSGGETVKSFSVDKIRELRKDAFIVPNEAQRKIYILQNAGTMSESAQNALLKIFEEPPKYVTFIAECGSKSALLPTILSRASVYSLGEEKSGAADIEKLEKARQTASTVVRAVCAGSELKVLKATAPLEKDKELFRLCLPEMTRMYTQALKSKYGDRDGVDEVSLEAGDCLTAARLLSLAQLTNECRLATEKNANHNLNITRLCAGCGAE